MLRMHPENRANCGEVVKSLEAIFTEISKDETYCLKAVPGSLRPAAVDVPMRSSSTLAFDPSSTQITEEEDFVQGGISGISFQETQGSREEVSPIHAKELPAQAPRYKQRPYVYAAVHGATDSQIAQEVAGRAGHPGLDDRQDRSWFRRLFLGCLG